MAARAQQMKIGINIGISSAFIVMVMVTTLGICLVVFFNMQRVMRDDLRKQIYNTVATGALLVDGDAHDALKDKTQETEPGYQAIKSKLMAIKASALQIRYVYTMRRGATGSIDFVVDAETNPETMSHIGDAYDRPTPELLTSLDTDNIQIEPGFTTDEWGTWLSGFAPIRTAEGRRVGILGVDMSAETIIKNERETITLLTVVASIVAVLVLILAILLSRRITTPLKRLEEDMIRIENFEIDGDVQIKSFFREITSIAETTADLKSSLRSFRKYVPSDLVAQLIRNHDQAVLGGVRKDLTILFSDIENFTTWSENLDPEALIKVMARYFSGMTEIIHRHHGTVDKYIGDAIMAFWGAPIDLDDHAFHACSAALECLAFQNTLNAQLTAEGLSPINTRFGINTGEVLVGNVGYEQRLNYTVLGDHVNVASRLEGLNKYYETNIIVSDNTMDRLDGRFQFRILDKVAVKGRASQITIFELCTIPAEAAAAALTQGFNSRFNQAAELYFSRKWQQSLPIFVDLQKSRPQDKAATIMAERCRNLMANDPGPDWQGYIILREK